MLRPILADPAEQVGGTKISQLQVGGLSLMRRALRAASRAGAREVLVLTDEPAEVDVIAREEGLHCHVEPFRHDADAQTVDRVLTPHAFDGTGNGTIGPHIVDAETRGEAERALLQSLRKPLSRSADGIVAYYVNRPISLAMSRHLVRTPVTPNQITTLALALGLLASGLAASGTYSMLVIAGLLLQLSSVLDGVDGELARLRLTSSHSGEWYDTIADDVVTASFVGALAWAMHVRVGHPMYATLAWVGPLLVVATALTAYRALHRKGYASHNAMAWGFEDGASSLPARIASAFAYIAKRDSHTVLLLVLLAANALAVAFWIVFGGAVLVAIGTLVQTTRE